MRILLKNIKTIVQVDLQKPLLRKGSEMQELGCLDDAWLEIDNGIISNFGPMSDFKGIEDWNDLTVIDASNKLVFPSWCDSHSHLVFASTREEEFVSRLKGKSYAQIALEGGGILNSAKKLQSIQEEVLVEGGLARLNEVMHQGTGAIEIKSGYGLSLEGELKMLRVIKKLKQLSPLTIKSTFLGAHAIPEAYSGNKQGYIDLIIDKMLPIIAEEQLADYCDVFCEANYFSKAETMQLLEAGQKFGLVPRVHAEQMSHSGGIEAGIACGAISVDHLEYINDADIAGLLNSNTMPTLLPGAQLFLQLPNPPVRKMIDAGLPVAIASDFNPGSCPTGNMNLMVALSCIIYKMTPEEAINAGTLNSAYAMHLSNSHGSIARGKCANLFITKEISSYNFIPYAFGSNLIDQVIINGQIQQIQTV